MGDHDADGGVDSPCSEDEAAVVACRVPSVHRADEAEDLGLGRHACDQAAEVAGLLTLGHVGEDVGRALLAGGTEGEGHIGVLLGHLEGEVLVLGPVGDDDVIALGDVLAGGGACIDQVHLLGVAVLDTAGKLLHRLGDAVMHRLAPPLVIDGVFDDQGDLYDV